MIVDSNESPLPQGDGSSLDFDAKDVFERVWKIAHELPEAGKLALFDASKSQLVILNALGAAFWWRLDGVRSLGDIALEISEAVESAPSADQVLEASLPFLNDLSLRGALMPR